MDFNTNTVLARGLRELLQRLEKAVNLKTPVNVFLAGGMAVHLYTSERTTTDVDAEFSSADPSRRLRMQIPSNLVVEVVEDGVEKLVYFDTNYNSSFALMHENYMQDAISVDMGVENLRIYVLSPVDLAVSKISRFAGNDREDISSLVRLGLTTADAIKKRAEEALPGYVGNERMLQLNIREAVELAREAEAALKNDLAVQVAGPCQPLLNAEQRASEEALCPQPAWTPEQERRAAGLGAIKITATGALLTFAEFGVDAIQEAGTAEKVNWRVVEDVVIYKCLTDDQQPANDVYRAIACASPAAMSQQQRAALRERIDVLADSLNADHALRPRTRSPLG